MVKKILSPLKVILKIAKHKNKIFKIHFKVVMFDGKYIHVCFSHLLSSENQDKRRSSTKFRISYLADSKILQRLNKT